MPTNIITTGQTFNATDAVTSTKLQNIASEATFDDPADETSLELSTTGTDNGKLRIKDGGVTKAKIENVANLRVLGNTSGSSVPPQEVQILDDDTMATADAATLATSESIKAYVDSNGITQSSGTAPFFGCRAFAAFDGSIASGSITPFSPSGNVASVERMSEGRFRVTFSTPMTNANYTVVASTMHQSNVTYGATATVENKLTTSFQIYTSAFDGTITPITNAFDRFNSAYVAFTVFA